MRDERHQLPDRSDREIEDVTQRRRLLDGELRALALYRLPGRLDEWCEVAAIRRPHDDRHRWCTANGICG